MLPINSAYHENFTRGTPDFPFDYHQIDERHPRYVMPYHYHSAFEILIMRKGELDVTLNENTFHLLPDDCLLIQGGIVHGGSPLGKDSLYECLVFSFEQLFDLERPPFSFLKRLSKGSLSLNPCIKHGEAPDLVCSVKKLFEMVRHSNGDHKENVTRSIKTLGLVLELFGDLEGKGAYTLYQDTMPSRYIKHMNKVSELFRYIYDNYQHQITLEDLSKVTGLSPKYFCRFFRELTGKRPMEYLNGFRIDCAASLLITSDDSINEIAYGCGFIDPCYFAKLFKRYRNISPRSYRQTHLVADPHKKHNKD